MATKAEIINKVNTDLASNSNIQAVSHRGVLHGSDESIIDNFYGIKTFDYDRVSGTTSNILTTSSNLNYEVDITKNGTRVNITGSLNNTSGLLVPSLTSVFEITNTDYLMQNTDLNAIFTYSVLFNGYSIGSDDVNLQLINNKLNILDVIPIGALIRFSITYNTAN